MSTYISQLIQQTGITLPRRADSRNPDDLAAILQAESGTDFSAVNSPIQEEHHEVVIPQPKQSVEPIAPQTGVPQLIGQRSPESTAIDRRSDQSASAMPMSDQFKVHSDHQDSIPFSLPSKASSSSDQVSSPKFSSPQEQSVPNAGAVTPEAVFHATAPDSLSVPEQGSIQPPRFSAVPSQPQTGQDSESGRSIPLDTSILQVHVALPVEQATSQAIEDLSPRAHTYLQVVRDWVAGSPTILKAVQEGLVPQPDSGSQTPSTPPGQSYPSPAAPATLDNTYPAESSTAPPVQQDFVLSIGSIHLTVTAPPPEMPVPPGMAPPTDATPDAEPFRLSRHYLRFR
jgi:hypothetical protein